jgi:hypothetical protein
MGGRFQNLNLSANQHSNINLAFAEKNERTLSYKSVIQIFKPI